MKKLLALIAALLSVLTVANCKNNEKTVMNNPDASKTEKILFINGSPNVNGNTAALAKVLLEGRKYETLMLTDYRINAYGQTLEGDQFDEVVSKMKEADIVVIGSPVYWHNICASVRTVMERFYGTIEDGAFKGRKLFFLYQGAAPTKMMIDDGEYSMSRFAGMYGFEYMGMANNKSEATALKAKLGK
jgi:putative NADPH-quinone reductase